ncbi:hypothetical protein [Actinoplanes sp. NPDC049265]|uniref:WXG100-like domain-containing protein n=1 Tax=Actinoplanes sp. NPDC049265 TaxID=3363902 RepID=UPI0037201B32
MAVAEPPDDYQLWSRVEAASLGWPDTDEDQMNALAGAWERAAGPFTTARDVSLTDLREAWGDDGGEMYSEHVDEGRELAGASAATLSGITNGVKDFAGVVTEVKTSIRDLITSNLPRYAETLTLPDGQRETAQAYFVERLAFSVDQMITLAAAELAGTQRIADYGGIGGFLLDGLGDTLENAGNDLTGKWYLAVGDGSVGAGEGLTSRVAEVKAAHADFLRGRADRWLDQARNTPTLTAEEVGRLFSRAADDQAGAVAAARTAGTLETVAGVGSKALGGGLAAAGGVIDVVDGSKEIPQATVSSGAGFAASWVVGGAAAELATAGFAAYVASGAVIGTAIPIPVVGTVAGILGGAAAGLIASGAVDWLWDGGAQTIANSVGDAAGEVWDWIF